MLRVTGKTAAPSRPVYELVELGGPVDRPGGVGRRNDLLGRQSRTVVGKVVTVHTDDGHVDEVGGGPLGRSHRAAGALDLGGAAPSQRGGGRVDDDLGSIEAVVQPLAGEHVGDRKTGAIGHHGAGSP